MTWTWELDLSGPEKLLLLALADYVNNDGVGAWPSKKTLAVRTSTDPRTVQRNLRKLEQRGLLRTQHRDGETSLYVINVFWEGGQIVPPTDEPEGETPVSGVGEVQMSWEGEGWVSPDPSVEPSVDPSPPPPSAPAAPEWSKLADKIAKDYHSRNRLEGFPGVLFCIRRAFQSGYAEGEIRVALKAIELDGQTVTTWRLKRVLESDPKRQRDRMFDENGEFRE